MKDVPDKSTNEEVEKEWPRRVEIGPNFSIHANMEDLFKSNAYRRTLKAFEKVRNLEEQLKKDK